MKKYSKKIALILALVLTLAIALPVLAQETNITGSYTATGDQIINVAVSGGSTVQAYLNPNGFPADVYQNKNDTENKPVKIDTLNASGNITTLPIVGVNKGTNKVIVRASVNAVQKGNFKFTSSIPGEKTTSGLVFLEVKSLDPTKNDDYKLGYDALGPNDDGTKWNDANRYQAFDGQKLLNVLNNWTHNWVDTKKNESYPDWLDKDYYAASTEKNEKERASAAKKYFTTAFNGVKKTGQKSTDLATNPTGFLDEIVILKKGVAESKNQVCVMAPATGAGPSYFVARLSGRIGKGDVGKKDKWWTSNDGFGASIIWTFQTTAADTQKDPDAPKDTDTE